MVIGVDEDEYTSASQRRVAGVPPSSVVALYAASGDGIRVLHRSELVANLPLHAVPAVSRGIGVPSPPPYSSRASSTSSLLPYPPPPPPPPSGALTVFRRGALRHLIVRGVGLTGSRIGRTYHSTFWVPDPALGEVGLLEFIHRREEGRGGGTTRHGVLIQSRPVEELQHNFSPAVDADFNIDLSHNAFRLSKTAAAVVNMHQNFQNAQQQSGVGSARRRGGDAAPVPPTIQIRSQDLEAAVAQNLQNIQEEEYFLVRYRDYSAWAVRQYPELVKRESRWRAYLEGDREGTSAGGSVGQRRRCGRGQDGYVEQCFAVHVGRDPGELIPITEAQLLFGLEIIQRQLLNQLPTSSNTNFYHHFQPDQRGAGSHQQFQIDTCYRALNADQFNSLWGVLASTGFAPVGVEGEERRKKQEEERTASAGRHPGAYIPPLWYDWRPTAIRKRVNHKIEESYHFVGQWTVRLVCVGVVTYVVYHHVPMVPTLVRSIWPGGHQHAVNNRGGGASASHSYYSEDMREMYRYRERGFFGNLLMGPKDLFDYLLGP